VGTLLTCTDLIAGKISSLPTHIYERQIGKNGRAIRRIAYEHDSYDLLSLAPNDEMSWQTFLYALICHALVWPGRTRRFSGTRGTGRWRSGRGIRRRRTRAG
jgi:hypothetical protein